LSAFLNPADEAAAAVPCAPCVAILKGEVLGPFRTPREAAAALDRRLAELGPLKHGDDAGSVVFVDPARYHAPKSETLNG
jgi:hypothetical protein